MVRGVLFDLDGTLLDRHSSLVVWLYQHAERCGDLLSEIPFPQYLEAFITLDARGHKPKGQLFREIQSSFGLPAGSDARLLDDFRTHFPHVCVPFPRMHQTLAELKSRGLAMGVVTNGRADSQNPKIDGLGIRGYFGAVLVSEPEKVRKPDPEIFRRALRRVKLEAGEAVFVGDNPEADIRGAQAVGMKTVWIRNDFWPAPEKTDAAVAELSGLPRVLDRFA